MRNQIRYTALGVAVMAGTSLAHAQTVDTVIAPPSAPLVIAQQPVVMPPPMVVTQPTPAVQTVPVQTVETVRTVETTAPGRRIAGHKVLRTRVGDRITTTRTVERVVAAPTPAVQAITQPVYTEVVEPPPAGAVPAYPGLYNVVTPAPLAPPPAVVAQPTAVAPAIAAQPVIGPVAPVPTYRYLYQPDRILVIDANTGIAVQAIPR
jgi:hypothetical protein